MNTKPRKPIKLFANENFYGCSPLVKKAIKEKIAEVNYYGENPIKLEEALAAKLGINSGKIAAGAGSVRLIDGIIQSFVDVNDEVLTFDKTFVAYAQLTRAFRRTCILAPVDDYYCRINNLLPFVNEKTKVIFLSNPNNPTGTVINHEELKSLLQSISSGIYVVIDEAYREYVTNNSFPDSLSLQKEFPNLIILRTFSKAYGLAGLRIGYAIADEKIISVLKQSRIPHFMNCFSSDAAMIALEDEAFINKCVAKNSKERDYLYKNLKKNGFNVIPSQGNFLYMTFENEESKMKVFNALYEKEIHVCNLAVFGQEKSLRIGVGDRKCGKEIIECLTTILI